MKISLRLFSWLFILTGVICEALLVFSLISHRLWLGWGVLAHFVGAILFFIGVRLRRVRIDRPLERRFFSIKDEHLVSVDQLKGSSVSSLPATPEEIPVEHEMPEDIWTRIVLPIGLCIPIFGIPGLALLVFFLKLDDQEYLKAVEEYRSFIRFQHSKKKKFEQIDVREFARQKLDLEPVVDLLATKEKSLVWGSIEMLSKMSDEKAVGMIRRTMDRQDMDIKFYSAWGLDRIETRFQKQRQVLEERLQDKLELTPLLELAKQFHRFLDSHLLEGPLLKQTAREALTWADRGFAAFPEDPSLPCFRAFFLSQAGEEKTARSAYLALMKEGKLLEAFFPDAAGLFFRIRDFSTVTQLIEVFAAAPENEKFLLGRLVETNLEDLRELWLPPERKPA